MKSLRIILAITALLSGISVGAEIRLPSFFSDGMVLQQQATVKIWGTSDNGDKVSLTTGWDGKAYSCKPLSNGSWSIKFKTPEAGGPYRISISDGTERVLNDVMLGEVWICAGQSNMEMPMKGFGSQPVENALELLLSSGNSAVRVFMTRRSSGKTPQADMNGRWEHASPATVPDFSAVAYLFARRLQSVLKVPVGVIVSAWGGTSILGWMPEKAVDNAVPEDDIIRIISAADRPKNYPGVLYNGMIAPVAGYAAKGFLWYQGCANVQFPKQYAPLLKSLIESWRAAWGARIPFYAVELAPHRYGRGNENGFERPSWVEEVTNMMKKTEKTALVPTSDAGNPTVIHPARKQVVGDRLALMALKNEYGYKTLEPEAPAIASANVIDGTIIIKTTSALGPANGLLRGFEIAGEDRIFYPAKAVVNTKEMTIIVKSDKVPEPVAVRYNFHNSVSGGDWKNWMGIPALPCRTDDWELE